MTDLTDADVGGVLVALLQWARTQPPPTSRVLLSLLRPEVVDELEETVRLFAATGGNQ